MTNNKKKLTAQGGFTLVELMISMVFAGMVLFGVGVTLVDSQRGWNFMYNRVYSDVVTDGYAARKMFDAVIRKASGARFLLDETGRWIEVYYYQDDDSTVLDRYARFYYDGGGGNGGQLNIEYGKLNPKETLSIKTICSNVSGCFFEGTGRSAQMILTLDNGSQTVAVTSSAVMHN